MRFLLALVFSLALATNSWGWGLISEQRTVSGETPTGGCMDGTYILAWDGDYGGTDGELEMCHTSGAGTLTGVNTGPVEITTAHGESLSYGIRLDTDEENVKWTQTADQYVDSSAAQTVWVRIYVEGTPSNTLYFFESGTSTEYAAMYTGLSSLAGIYRHGADNNSASGGSWTSGSWIDVGYTYDQPNGVHSYNNNDAGWTADENELDIVPFTSPLEIVIGNDSIFQTSATSTNGVRVDKFALVAGYQASKPWAPYLIDEDFSGTTAPTDWVDTNTPDYTTEGEVAIDMNDRAASPTFAAQSTLYAAVHFETPVLGNTGSTYMTVLYDSADALMASVLIDSSQRLRPFHGTGNTTSTQTLSNGTEYWMWIHWVISSGADDGTMTVEVNTSGDYDTAVEWVSISNGTGGNNVDTIQVRQTSSDTGGDIIFHDVIVDDEAIGDF